jgi:serine/threonine-protein kinase
VSDPIDGGRHVGRYRILDFLGAGAMGEVYLAEDPQIERKLAIKTVRLTGRPQEIEDRKRRLLREARAAGRMLHPNVVTLFDAGEDQGVLFLAFEFVEGTDLAGRLENGPALSLRDVLRIIRQVADALDFAHRQGIVHRDIKPSNILIDKQGKVKVADFGIAKVTGQSTELTVAGSVMGSPQYLSPEQIRGEELDGRSDIFSLGVVLYELLSHKRPFDGDTITTLVYQILHKEPPPISELRAVPERMEVLLRRMLAKGRDDRYATAAEVAAEVAACESELSDETLSAPASDLPQTRVLPRRTTEAVIPEGKSVRSQTTAPSRPPVPTPPPPPKAATHPPVPPPAAAPARQGQGARLAVAIFLVLAVLGGAAAGGVWWFFFRQPQETGVAQADAQRADTSQTSPAVGPGVPTPAPGPVTSEPSPAPIHQTLAQDQRPASPSPNPPPSTPLKIPPTGREQTPPVAPRHDEPSPLPTPTQRSPVTPPVQAPAPPSDDRADADDRDERPSRSSPGPADQVLQTGLQLVFRTTPPDAFVLVDGTNIGKASEYSGQKGTRPYTLSDPGEHLIKLRSEGLREHRILVQASETAGVTPILTRLRPLAAAQADASDLKTYRVREGVAFKVDVPNAQIIVDGQPAGPAASFPGRLMSPKSWLKLPVGRHRIGVVAPGKDRQDFLVEVSEGADKDKDRIEVSLGGSR